MTRISMTAIAACCCAIALALGQPTTTSRAAGTPAPTPVVSVTTLPALPSPGVATAHPLSPSALPPPSSGPAMASPPAQLTPTPTPALPPPGTFILINGLVANPAFVTLDQLQRLRSTSLTMRVAGRGVLTVTGAPLAAVLDLTHPTVVGGTTTSTRAYVLVSGLSGQPAIVAFPEFESAFGGRHVLLAYLVNGRAVKPGAAMLVVQGDATGGRFVEGVTHVQVFEATPSP